MIETNRQTTSLPARAQPGMPIYADDWNKVLDAIGVPGKTGGSIATPYAPVHKMTFYPRQIAVDQVRVSGGNYDIGSVTYGAEDTSVTLTGNPCYVFIELIKGSTAMTIEIQASLPTHSLDRWRWRLQKWVPIAGVYYMAAWYSVGDKQFDSPLT